MELLRITGQQSQTLLEFYDPKKWPHHWGRMPEMMCQLISVLIEEEHESVWVFTSHAELLFTNKDNYENWLVLVKIVKIEDNQYYKITATQKDPWHHITGFADNSALASKLVIEGLAVSALGKTRNIFLDAN